MGISSEGAEKHQMKDCRRYHHSYEEFHKERLSLVPDVRRPARSRETVNLRGKLNTEKRKEKEEDKEKKRRTKEDKEDKRGQKEKKQREAKARCLLGSRRALNASHNNPTL